MKKVLAVILLIAFAAPMLGSSAYRIFPSLTGCSYGLHSCADECALLGATRTSVWQVCVLDETLRARSFEACVLFFD